MDGMKQNSVPSAALGVRVRKYDIQQRFYISLDGTGYYTKQKMTAEQPCPASHYRCTSEWLHCLPAYTRCNGFSDCVHGEDEQDCEVNACPGFYRCWGASTVCVHWDHLCDGWGQCPQRDDELMCDMLTCPEGCLCQGHSFICGNTFQAHLFPQLRYVDGWWRFSKNSTTVTSSVAWFAGFLMSLIPFLPGLSHWGLRGQSGLCRLALFQDYDSSTKFRWFTVLVIINFILSLTVTAGQVVIYRKLPTYRIGLDPARRSVYTSVHVTGKMAVTGVVCWLSFGLVTVAGLRGVSVAARLHGHLVVWVLPVQSALGPLLYLTTVITQPRGQVREERLLQVLKSHLERQERNKKVNK
ncbi:hypothetical protein ACOMHN_025719 [Nucella lapillus]